MPTWKVDGRYYTPESIRELVQEWEDFRAALEVIARTEILGPTTMARAKLIAKRALREGDE